MRRRDGLVTRAEVDATFAAVVGPELPTFEAAGTLAYVRQAEDEVRHRVSLAAYKGARDALRWGVVLPFVPSAWEGGLRYRRGARAASDALFVKAQDDLLRQGRDERAAFAHRVGTARAYRRELAGAWRASRARCLAWFERAGSLSAVAELAIDQATREPVGTEALHFPPPALVAALTLARLGRVDEARAWLGQVQRTQPPDGARSLELAMERAANRPAES
jgi:hypothetical protein